MSYKINFNSTYANRGMGLENDINETNGGTKPWMTKRNRGCRYGQRN